MPKKRAEKPLPLSANDSRKGCGVLTEEICRETVEPMMYLPTKKKTTKQMPNYNQKGKKRQQQQEHPI